MRRLSQILALGTITVIVLLIKLGGSGMHIYDVTYPRIVNTQLVRSAST
jgi:hypothetical protein